jgi:hypothetical protein
MSSFSFTGHLAVSHHSNTDALWRAGRGPQLGEGIQHCGLFYEKLKISDIIVLERAREVLIKPEKPLIVRFELKDQRTDVGMLVNPVHEASLLPSTERRPSPREGLEHLAP